MKNVARPILKITKEVKLGEAARSKMALCPIPVKPEVAVLKS